jgi:hypothetical protein
MASNPAEVMFESLMDFSSLNELILNEEAEGLHLECKAPGGPQLNQGLKAQLAQAAFGFANTGGGIIIWGISTVRHAASGLDVLTQVEPITQCRTFAQQVDRAVRVSTYPNFDVPPSRVLRESPRDTKGVAVTYIPLVEGDPVQSLVDRKFYFRHSDEFLDMPYEMLRRMFAGASSPSLQPVFDSRLIKIDGSEWDIPIILQNNSSAAAEHSQISVAILNPDACESISAVGLSDTSAFNPGQAIYMRDIDSPIFRGLNLWWAP